MEGKQTKYLKIGDLAQKTGLSVSTIRHWVNEGLVPVAYKTGKTMSYYDSSCVERIKFIIRMKNEKFLPLDVIKRLLEDETAEEPETRFSDAIFSIDALTDSIRPVDETAIEQYTGYSREGIDLLEGMGLIAPRRIDGVKYYDAIDCKIIENIRKREEVGLPSHYSLETVSIYFNAVRRAQEEDVKRFVKTFLGTIPADRAARIINAADEALDRLIILFKHRIERDMTERALTGLLELPDNLKDISFLPVLKDYNENGEFPSSESALIHRILTGDYAGALIEVDRVELTIPSLSREGLKTLLLVLMGNVDGALEVVDELIPEPGFHLFENIAAALANFFALPEAGGVMKPALLGKKAVEYLEKSELVPERDPLVSMLCRYIQGAVYALLPDIFDVREKSLSILTGVLEEIRSASELPENLSPWLKRAIRYDIFPRVEIRIHRFLAEVYLARRETGPARQNMEAIIRMAGNDGEISGWARNRLLSLKGE